MNGKPTACILCECNCGIEVQLEDRTLAKHPRRQGAPGVAGLHLREGAAPRPLPERPRPADLARCAGAPTARSRRSTGTPRSPRSPSGFARIRDDHGGERSSTTAAAGRGTTSAAPTAARSCKRARRAVPLERAGAGEDRRVLGRRAALRRRTPAATSSTPRSRLRRQEPVAVAQLPARPHGAQGDRQGPGAVDDRHRPADHRDGQARRLPPAGAAGHRRVVPRGAGRGARAGGPLRRRRSWPSTSHGVDAVRDVLRATCRSPTTRSAAASTRS